MICGISDLSEILITNSEDLMHKAVGWLLREVGKQDRKRLDEFLEQHYSQLARTTLRYAIEKHSPQERQNWLKKPI